MPLLKDCEIYFAKLDPARPSTRFSKSNPKWELQIRTTSKEQKKEWEELGLKPKAVIPEEGPPYYRVNISKRTIKANKTESSPVEVIDGNMNPVDPNTIGNGSVGNIRIYQYPFKDAETGSEGIASVLMGVQLTKLILYTPGPRDDDFQKTTTEVVTPAKEGKGESDTPKPPDTDRAF